MALLRLGSQGVEVKAWQTFLTMQGFYVGYQIDGIFGPSTKAATKAFQSTYATSSRTTTQSSSSLLFVRDGSSMEQQELEVRPQVSGMVDPTTLDRAYELGFMMSTKMSRGSQGIYVLAWQTFLHAATRFDPGRPDGMFGPTTQSATRAFQAYFGLPATGVINLATLHLAQSQGFMTLILQLHSRGQDVVAWQTFLNQQHKNGSSSVNLNCGRVDGIFGPMTLAATRTFQALYQLKPQDGLVGPNTIEVAQSMGFAISEVENYSIPSLPSSSSSTWSSSFPPKGTYNVMVDISHFQTQVDFHRLKASGIQAVISKCTEGYGYTDPTYKVRRKKALAAGLLWGAYHFGTGTAVHLQVNYFLDVCVVDANTLLVLDWEENPSGTQMTLSQAREFVQGVKDRTKRWPVLYGGRLLRESMQQSGGDTILNQCPLWVAEYSNRQSPRIPVGWSQYTFWQYTNGIVGHQPRSVDGILPDNCCDRSVFQPTTSTTTSTMALADLDDFWKTGMA
ncbi:hypothetical protein ACA910_022019 [Epithemia clementina (nom. ined.)]